MTDQDWLTVKAVADKRGSLGPPCPGCGHTISKVLQTRAPLKRDDFKRRRKCCDCGQRFTSYEAVKKIA